MSRTPPDPELLRHLARYLAGLSASGARVSREQRARSYGAITRDRPELRDRLERLIRKEQTARLIQEGVREMRTRLDPLFRDMFRGG